MTDPDRPCQCSCLRHPNGCPHEAHEHYRPGSDCGCCGTRTCRRYRAAIPAPSPDPEASPA